MFRIDFETNFNQFDPLLFQLEKVYIPELFLHVRFGE